MEDKKKEEGKAEVNAEEGSAINLNINAGGLAGDMAQQIVELDARLSALESRLSELTGNTDGKSAEETENAEGGEDELPAEAIADVEDAAASQSGDEAMVEEVYEDEEDIVNLRGNLKTAVRVIDRRFNLADYVAGKTGLRKPENLREANAIMAAFRKTHAALKGRAAKWASDSAVRNNAGPAKNNMDRLMTSWKRGE